MTTATSTIFATYSIADLEVAYADLACGDIVIITCPMAEVSRVVAGISEVSDNQEISATPNGDASIVCYPWGLGLAA